MNLPQSSGALVHFMFQRHFMSGARISLQSDYHCQQVCRNSRKRYSRNCRIFRQYPSRVDAFIPQSPSNHHSSSSLAVACPLLSYSSMKVPLSVLGILMAFDAVAAGDISPGSITHAKIEESLKWNAAFSTSVSSNLYSF